MLCRKLDRVIVKGKKEAEEIYELLGPREIFPESRFAALDEFESALELYFGGDFRAAAALFESLAAAGDQVAGVFAKRCRRLQDDAPQGWNGVWQFHEK
jgi:hypothetical protein